MRYLDFKTLYGLHLQMFKTRWFKILFAVGATVGLGLLYVLLNPYRLGDADVLAGLPDGFEADAVAGEQLFYIGGCANCHESEGGAMGGGAPLDTPFGLFQPPNISPDPDVGIGGWSDAEFVTAMVRGVSPDNKHYFPAFPYTSYAKAEFADLVNIKAYLDTLPAVSAAAPNHELSFPFNIRLGVGLWKLAFADLTPFEADPSQDDVWNRGAYLANGLGHCGMCHTPRTIFQAEDPNRAFHGAPALKEGEEASERLAGIAADDILNGLSEWSGAVDEDSAMFHVTQTYSNNVADAEHQALATYLSSLPRK